MNVQGLVEFNSIRVAINDVTHLRFVLSEYRGMQTWKNGPRFWIEITLAGSQSITCDYDDIEKWKAVIAELDRVIIAGRPAYDG